MSRDPVGGGAPGSERLPSEELIRRASEGAPRSLKGVVDVPQDPHPPEQQQGHPEQHSPPGRHHNDGAVRAQWAVESRSRNRSRRFSVL